MVKIMFCPNCGVPVPENTNFCPNCGMKLTQEQETSCADVPQEPVAAPVEAPIDNPTVVLAETPAELPWEGPAEIPAEAPAEAPEQPAPFAQADFDAAPKKKKSKKKLGVTLAVIGVLLAAAAILTFVFWPQVSGFFVKTFGSPEAYFQHVEKQAVADSADTVSTYYDTLINNASGNNAAEGTMRLQVSDKLLQLMGADAADVDIDWINDVALEYETVVDGTLTMMNMVLDISGTDIVDLSMIVDITTENVYLALPSLSGTYLHIAPDYYSGTSSSMQNLLSDEDFLKALPDEDTVNKLLRRYLQIVIDNTSNVDKSSDTLQIGDYEQKVTVLEYELTQKGVLKIAKAVLKEAKSDKDLKKCINDVADYLEDKGMISDADSVYDDFKDALEVALEQLNDVDASSETLLVVTDYVDGASKIIGRRLEIQDQTILEYATVTKGKDYASEWDFGNGQLIFRGDGTISGDTREGDYVLTVEGVDFLNVYASYNEKKLDDGLLDGRFRLTPTATMLDGMGLDSQVKSLISGMNLGLELVISNGKKDSSMAFNLVSGSEVLLGLSAEASVAAGKQVTLPTDTISDRYSDDWAEELDFDKIIDALRKTNVPKELVDSLEETIDMMTNPYYYYDNYYNDYYSDYYYGY